MGWSTQQIQTAAIAARSAGLDDARRRLVLRQLPRAMYCAGGRSTEPSSRSPRLTQADFEIYMSICERTAGGTLEGYATGHWAARSDGEWRRMHRLIEQLGADLAALGAPGWAINQATALEGWIKARVNPDKTTVQELDYSELHALINGLRAVKKRMDVRRA